MSDTGKMRKTYSIFFLLCTTLPAVLIYFSLIVEKQHIKNNIREKTEVGYNKSHLKKVSIASKDAHLLIEWENENEFEYNDLMHDVIKKEATKDSLIFWCLLDEEETIIKEKLEDLLCFLSGGYPIQSETQHLLEKIFKKLYCSSNLEESIFLSSTHIGRSPFQPGFCSELSTEVPTPPPNDNRI